MFCFPIFPVAESVLGFLRLLLLSSYLCVPDWPNWERTSMVCLLIRTSICCVQTGFRGVEMNEMNEMNIEVCGRGSAGIHLA